MIIALSVFSDSAGVRFADEPPREGDEAVTHQVREEQGSVEAVSLLMDSKSSGQEESGGCIEALKWDEEERPSQEVRVRFTALGSEGTASTLYRPS